MTEKGLSSHHNKKDFGDSERLSSHHNRKTSEIQKYYKEKVAQTESHTEKIIIIILNKKQTTSTEITKPPCRNERIV